jgi:RimJ/RimL family protein N-acetyltransferase
LEAVRLRLRPWDLARDLPAFGAICRDPQVMRYIGDGHLWTEEESRRWMETNLETMVKFGFCQWAVEATGGALAGQLLGFCGLAAPADLPARGPVDPPGIETHMGWRLSRASWGKGYATEAAGVALADAFGRCGFERVLATVQPANLASAAVARKLGMEQLDVGDEKLLVFAVGKERWETVRVAARL